MAAFAEKFKALIGIEDDIAFDDGYDEEDNLSDGQEESSSYGLGAIRGYENWDNKEPKIRKTAYAGQGSRSNDTSNVFPLNAGSDTLKVLTQRFKIVVVEPKSLDECPKLVDNLKSRKPVIINFEHIEDYIARSIFNFMNGATCALSGKVQGISNNIFVFLPENVDVSTNSEHKGITFGVDDGNPWKI